MSKAEDVSNYRRRRKQNLIQVSGGKCQICGFTQIGEQFGVKDNTIRKWCDSMNLPRIKKEINSYSDEEWEKI